MSLRHSRLAIGLVLCTIISVGGLILADPASPVTVVIADSPDPVASGAEILYTTTIVNTGGSKLTNVVFSDQVNGIAGIGVPPQLQLSSTRGSCNQSGNLVTCNAGTIPGNGSWVVTIRGVVTASNDDGHKCISDLIWEADTIEPGVTPLKWKLNIPEAPKSDICQS